MADNEAKALPAPTPQQRRIAAEAFEKANQVLAGGHHDYGIQQLLNCCKLDPGNLIYRQTLRRTEKVKYNNNLRGSRFAWLTTSASKARIKAAKQMRNYLKVLEHGEEVLTRNPWDIGAQMDMAVAADALGLVDVAVWTLEQARQKDPNHASLNRSLARLYEQRGNFAQAIALWELVKRADPSDVEAAHKAKDLAASETIVRGQYETAPGETPAPIGSSARAGKKPEAVDRLARETDKVRERITADPTKHSNYLDLAALYRRANQPEQARAVLEEGLGPTGNHFQLTLELAELALLPFRQNLLHAEEKIKADPGNAELSKIRQGLRKEINSRELELFRTKAERFPTELSHRLELGNRLLRAGRIDEAIAELQAARADGRLAWRALLGLGQCFQARNNWRLARRNFEDALQALPASEQNGRKELLFLLAKGCADAGELAEAVEKAHDLANLDFAYRDIGRLLDEWQARLQQA
jgi:tetratricopeptide (TPR) repeat protein